MDYKYFKNKYIDDININELNWLKNNSYLNNLVYYGRIIHLTDYKLKQSDFFNIIKNIYTKLNNFNNINELVDIGNLFYKIYYQISNNINLINDDHLLNNLFLLYNVYNKKIEQQQPKVNKIRLWNYPLIRDLYKDLIKLGLFPLIKVAAIYAENGDYDLAYKFLNTNFKYFLPSNLNNLEIYWQNITFFYIIKYARLAGINSENYENQYNIFINNNFDKLLNKNILFALKIPEYFLDSESVIGHVNSLNMFLKYFKNILYSYNNINFNNYNIKTLNIINELIREPIIFLQYYLVTKNKLY